MNFTIPGMKKYVANEIKYTEIILYCFKHMIQFGIGT